MELQPIRTDNGEKHGGGFAAGERSQQDAAHEDHDEPSPAVLSTDDVIVTVVGTGSDGQASDDAKMSDAYTGCHATDRAQVTSGLQGNGAGVSAGELVRAFNRDSQSRRVLKNTNFVPWPDPPVVRDDECESGGDDDGEEDLRDGAVETGPFIQPSDADKELVQASAPRERRQRLAQDENEKAEEFESRLHAVLRSAEIEGITSWVTPRALTKCKTNSLSKALEVSHELDKLVHLRTPDEQEFLALQKSVDDFAVALLEPLKTDYGARDVFASGIEIFVQKAIEKEQKKFLAHPVVYSLLHDKWYGEFVSFRFSRWTERKGLLWFFLCMWTIVDFVLFPVLFLVFWIGHLIKEAAKKGKEYQVGFILCSSGPDRAPNFHDFIRDTVKEVVTNLGYNDGKYAVLARRGGVVRSMGFVTGYSEETFFRNISRAPSQPSWMPTGLQRYLREAKKLFRKPGDDTVKKVLLIFADKPIAKTYSGKVAAEREAKSLSDASVKIMAVTIGPEAKPHQLDSIVSEPAYHIRSSGLESPGQLEKTITSKWYLAYFCAPYFVFYRDMISYLLLLLLHCYVCMSTSSVALSWVEIAIFVFFLGRVVGEVSEFFADVRESRRKACLGSDEHSQLVKKLLLYFRNQWNVLDLVCLSIFLVIFAMHLSTLPTVHQNRSLAVISYLYGLNTLLLTSRVFGSVIENIRGIGVVQIALIQIVYDVMIVFGQFFVVIVAFSLAITKIVLAGKSFLDSSEQQSAKYLGLSGWWSTLQHLLWSLLGLADTDQFDSLDEVSSSLSRGLYALFLISGVVLLMNLLIAVLSNVYQSVEKNSLAEWFFKKSINFRTYASYHPVPVPLNLISLPLLALLRIVRKRCTKSKKQETIQELKLMQGMDQLVKRLEDSYFSTHGSSFPLTGDKKLDYVVHEMEGNRTMATRISQKVFSNEDQVWHSEGIRVEGNTLTYEGPSQCSQCEENDSREQHSARYDKALTQDTPTFEVLIHESGACRFLTVGVVLEHHDIHSMPGREADSVGYRIHEDVNGCTDIVENDCYAGGLLKDSMPHRGDIVGCTVHFEDKTDLCVPVSFTLNGREIRRCSMKHFGRNLYPCIGMAFGGISVQFTMGRFHQSIPKPAAEDIVDAMGKLEARQGELGQRFNALQHEVRQTHTLLRELLSALDKKDSSSSV